MPDPCATSTWHGSASPSCRRSTVPFWSPDRSPVAMAPSVAPTSSQELCFRLFLLSLPFRLLSYRVCPRAAPTLHHHINRNCRRLVKKIPANPSSEFRVVLAIIIIIIMLGTPAGVRAILLTLNQANYSEGCPLTTRMRTAAGVVRLPKLISTWQLCGPAAIPDPGSSVFIPEWTLPQNDPWPGAAHYPFGRIV